MSKKEILNTTNAPAAIGPYNQAVKVENTLYVSGQIPLVPETMELITTGVVDETHQVFQNIKAILSRAGYIFEDVVKVSIFISDMANFELIIEAYAQFFTENLPAGETVAVRTLPKNV